MKTFSILLVTAMFSTYTFAQINSPSSKVELSITSQVGSFSIPTKFNTRPLPRCIEGCFLAGSAASTSRGIGVEARFKIYRSLNLSSGLSYIKNSYYDVSRISAGGPLFTVLQQRSLRFLNIPIKSHLKLLKSNKDQIFSMYLELGVINHINLSQEFPEESSFVELNRYDLSGAVSLGIGVKLNSLTIELAPYYQHSLRGLGEDKDPYEDFRIAEDDPYSPNKFSPRNLGANINFTFGI